MRLKLQFNTNDTTPLKETIIKNIDDMHVSYDLVKQNKTPKMYLIILL